MLKARNYFLKTARFLIVLLVVISGSINISYHFQYSVDVFITLQNLLTLLGVLGFVYYSSLILFKKVDLRSRTLALVLLVICSLLFINYLYTIIREVIPPLFKLTNERFIVILGGLYSIYAISAIYYFAVTWITFFKAGKATN